MKWPKYDMPVLWPSIGTQCVDKTRPAHYAQLSTFPLSTCVNQNVHLAKLLLGAGLPSICKTILVVLRQRKTHPSQLLWLWILSMDLLMISTFLPIHSSLITDQLPHPIWCKVVGFITNFVAIFSSLAFMLTA
eukprot:g65890.t1